MLEAGYERRRDPDGEVIEIGIGQERVRRSQSRPCAEQEVSEVGVACVGGVLVITTGSYAKLPPQNCC